MEALTLLKPLLASTSPSHAIRTEIYSILRLLVVSLHIRSLLIHIRSAYSILRLLVAGCASFLVRDKCSKVLSMVPFYGKYTMALTSKNFRIFRLLVAKKNFRLLVALR